MSKPCLILFCSYQVKTTVKMTLNKQQKVEISAGIVIIFIISWMSPVNAISLLMIMHCFVCISGSILYVEHKLDPVELTSLHNISMQFFIAVTVLIFTWCINNIGYLTTLFSIWWNLVLPTECCIELCIMGFIFLFVMLILYFFYDEFLWMLFTNGYYSFFYGYYFKWNAAPTSLYVLNRRHGDEDDGNLFKCGDCVEDLPNCNQNTVILHCGHRYHIECLSKYESLFFGRLINYKCFLCDQVYRWWNKYSYYWGSTFDNPLLPTSINNIIQQHAG